MSTIACHCGSGARPSNALWGIVGEFRVPRARLGVPGALARLELAMPALLPNPRRNTKRLPALIGCASCSAGLRAREALLTEYAARDLADVMRVLALTTGGVRGGAAASYLKAAPPEGQNRRRGRPPRPFAGGAARLKKRLHRLKGARYPLAVRAASCHAQGVQRLFSSTDAVPQRAGLFALVAPPSSISGTTKM